MKTQGSEHLSSKEIVEREPSRVAVQKAAERETIWLALREEEWCLLDYLSFGVFVGAAIFFVTVQLGFWD